MFIFNKIFQNLRYGLLPIILLFCATNSFSKEYYVSVCGSDSSKGGFKSPFRTISKAKSLMLAGDICYIREGEYSEDVDIADLKGEPNKPIIFAAYRGEKVVLKGTKSLNDLKWSLYKDNIYVADVDEPVTQLFLDGVTMTSARWPNANWHDGTFWNKSKSQMRPETGLHGFYVNKKLSEFNFSLKGAFVVTNSYSWRTFASTITEHSPSSSYFLWDDKNVPPYKRINGAVTKHGYFIEGKKELIDVATEWQYDVKEKKLYLYTPDGEEPSNYNVEGKVQDYFFNGHQSQYLKFVGLNFFGTTVRFEECRAVTVEDCDFLYPSYCKRMIGDISPVMLTYFSPQQDQPCEAKIINCDFAFGDGPALEIKGDGNMVYNCSFHDFDYSCLNNQGNMFSLNGSHDMVFSHNTAWNTGSSEMISAGRGAIIEYNDLSRSGFLQYDGALVQVGPFAQPNTVVRYNWTHDTVKQGIRFDNSNEPDSPFGGGGTVCYNVAWKTDRIFFKGDKHKIFNNVGFDNKNNDIAPSSNTKIHGYNFSTITRNNVCNKLSGEISRLEPVPGIEDHNWVGQREDEDIRSQLRDPDNLDFRPKRDSKIIDAGASVEGQDYGYVGKGIDLGAYEYGADEYWIPGKRYSIATVPIPCDKSESAKVDADLMWLGAYKASEYKVYFGENKDELKYQGRQKNNIFTPKKLISGKKYYWRIDSVVKGKIAKGDVWSFIVN